MRRSGRLVPSGFEWFGNQLEPLVWRLVLWFIQNQSQTVVRIHSTWVERLTEPVKTETSQGGS